MQRCWRPIRKESLNDDSGALPRGWARPQFVATNQNGNTDSLRAPRETQEQAESFENQNSLEIPTYFVKETDLRGLNTGTKISPALQQAPTSLALFHPSFVYVPSSSSAWASYQQNLQQPGLRVQANQFAGQSSSIDDFVPPNAFHEVQHLPLPTQQKPSETTHLNKILNGTAAKGFGMGHAMHGRSESGNSASRRNSGASPSPERKRRKKVSPSDNRWSRRYTWPEEYHRAFVAAIFDVGLQEATTSILVQKVGADSDLTTQCVSSVLQSLRSNNLDVKALFESSDSLLSKSSCQGQCADQKELIRGYDKDSNESLNGCRIVVNDLENHEVTAIPVPDMTKAEKQSATGQAMGHLLALVLSLKQKLIVHRALVAKEKLTYAALADVHHDEDMGEKSAQDIGLQQAEDVARSQFCRYNLVQVMDQSVELQHDMRSLKEQEYNKYQSSYKATQWDEKRKSPEVGRAEEVNPTLNAAPVVPLAEDQGEEPTNLGEIDNGLDLGDISDEKFFEFLMNN